MTFSFANPAFLVLGIVAALLVWVGLVLQTRRRRRLAAHLGSVEEARRRGMARLRRPRLDRKLLLGLAVAFVAVAAAEPTPVTPPPAPAYVSPEPLVIALDISASMQAEDVLPTRLGRAVQVARDVVEAAEGREVGLLVFAGKPYVLMPPTSDLAAVRFLLEGVSATIWSAYDPGSLIGPALHEAATLMNATRSPGSGGEVLLISDGDSAEAEDALAAVAGVLAERGIVLHAVGVGTAAGAPMTPTAGSSRQATARPDPSGPSDISRLDERLLRQLADRTGGRFAAADNAGEVARITGSITGRSAAAEGRLPNLTPDDPSLTLAVAALLMLLLDGLIEARERWAVRSHARGEAPG